MPAHRDRRGVLLRLYPADAKKLDGLVSTRGIKRSDLLVKLIRQSYDKLPVRKRRELEKED